MNLEALADLHATLVEISASAAVMQSEIKALMATHPNPEALRTAFLEEIEKHTARALALPVPDELCDRIQALAQRALKDMPKAADAGKPVPRHSLIGT
ncbi:MAG TPA: hypothetical protein VFF03_15755 [Rhodocyclaceae bacterium]|nr:hypothetical protein [Rhodocyclaceae bacterium]